MIYCIDPTVEEPIMLLNKHIGFDEEEGQGVDGSLFQQELLQLDTLGKKRIIVWINSPGGSVMDGYSIYSTILKTSTPVDTYCVGCAASIAGVIFQAGRKRIMADYSWLMYHNPFGGDNKEMVSTMKQSIIKMIAARCGSSEDKIEQIMNRETYILPDEALKLKFCDEIDSSVVLNTKYLKKVSNITQFHRECNKVVDSILNNNNMSQLTKVCMKLGLNDSAQEDHIIAAIAAIENRAKTAEDKAKQAMDEMKNKSEKDSEAYDKLKADLEEKRKAFDKLKAEMDDCKSKLDAMEEDKAKAELEAKKDKAKVMVENFAKIGKIKNDATTILKWTSLAVSDFDETKNMLEELPLNKTAPAVNNGTAREIEKGTLPTTALGLSVQNRLKRLGKI